MSETPRTDEFYWRETGSNPVGRPVTEWAEFARMLERELAAMTSAKELAERQVALLRTALENAATRLHTANLVGAFESGEELAEYLATGYQNAHRALEAGKEGGKG